MTSSGLTNPVGLAHVRLTVTDIGRSKAFYEQLLGVEPAADFSDQVDEPGVREDPAKLFGGCVFPVGDQLLGLRPVGAPGDRFDSTRVGLDHVSVQLASTDDLHAAVERLDAAGVEHGELTDLGEMGMEIVSVQDPDDINLELAAANGQG